MTDCEKTMIEIDVLNKILFAEGDTIEEKICNAISALKARAKREGK